jgi:hypothetical protein
MLMLKCCMLHVFEAYLSELIFRVLNFKLAGGGADGRRGGKTQFSSQQLRRCAKCARPSKTKMRARIFGPPPEKLFLKSATAPVLFKS